MKDDLPLRETQGLHFFFVPSSLFRPCSVTCCPRLLKGLLLTTCSLVLITIPLLCMYHSVYAHALYDPLPFPTFFRVLPWYTYRIQYPCPLRHKAECSDRAWDRHIVGMSDNSSNPRANSASTATAPTQPSVTERDSEYYWGSFVHQ